MSSKNVNQFHQVVMQDPALKEQFRATAESKSDRELYRAKTDGNVELSDEQLEAVAGGSGGFDYGYELYGIGDDISPSPRTGVDRSIH